MRASAREMKNSAGFEKWRLARKGRVKARGSNDTATVVVEDGRYAGDASRAGRCARCQP